MHSNRRVRLPPSEHSGSVARRTFCALTAGPRGARFGSPANVEPRIDRPGFSILEINALDADRLELADRNGVAANRQSFDLVKTVIVGDSCSAQSRGRRFHLDARSADVGRDR